MKYTKGPCLILTNAFFWPFVVNFCTVNKFKNDLRISPRDLHFVIWWLGMMPPAPDRPFFCPAVQGFSQKNKLKRSRNWQATFSYSLCSKRVALYLLHTRWINTITSMLTNCLREGRRQILPCLLAKTSEDFVLGLKMRSNTPTPTD